MAIRNFKDKGTEDINYGRSTKAALRTLPKSLHTKAQVKLARLGAAEELGDFVTLPGNRFEILKGDRKGQFSIRINEKYRICFRWDGQNVHDVEIVDYH